MIAVNLGYIHDSPLNRRLTTTQTSTHLIVPAGRDWLFSRCVHAHFSLRDKDYFAPRQTVNERAGISLCAKTCGSGNFIGTCLEEAEFRYP